MATMTISNMDEQLKTRLRINAAMHGRSMEEEARDILRSTLSLEPVSGQSLVESIRARLEPLGGVELEIPPREAIRTPVDFGA
jgi:plasmid stability protein